MYPRDKKFKGAKRHVLMDREGGALLMGVLFGLCPFLLKLYAAASYQGAKLQDGLKAICVQINQEIVSPSDLHKIFGLPIVERAVGWLNVPPTDQGLRAPQPERTRVLRWASIRLTPQKTLSEQTVISGALSATEV